jgi:hypothetical protein
MFAERGEDSQWRTIGGPVPDASFETMSAAADYAETRNMRQFGVKFDWAKEPRKAWLAVREDQRGAVRVNELD